VGLDAKQSELNGLISESQKAIADISANESSAKKEKANLATESAQADAAVDQYFQEYYAEQARLAAANGGGNSANNSGGSGGYQSKGNFTWPVPGVTSLSSPFGSRPEGYHKGVDIASGGIYGKAIVAADSGKVIQASFGGNGNGYSGYGNVVVIDHGNGYSTLYAHCSSIAVSKGSLVTKGQIIAYVGSTGDSTGPHLHFEIRVNGVANNPMNWFGR
jgi:murein DD-endopeptidase MepM/ murein hydrolase activator NlpD